MADETANERLTRDVKSQEAGRITNTYASQPEERAAREYYTDDTDNLYTYLHPA